MKAILLLLLALLVLPLQAQTAADSEGLYYMEKEKYVTGKGR